MISGEIALKNIHAFFFFVCAYIHFIYSHHDYNANDINKNNVIFT